MNSASQPPTELRESSLVLRHDGCWLTELSRQFPSITIAVWALYQAGDMIAAEAQVQGAAVTEHPAIKDWLSKNAEIHELRYTYEGPSGLRFHVQYGASASLYPIIARHKLVALTSSHITQGMEYYTLVGESANVQRLVADLSKAWPCKVSSSARVKASLSALVSGSMVRDARLTERQWTALQIAFAHGYYEVPRKEGLASLAGRMGIAASSFLYHLRQAERKILGVIISGEVYQRRRPRVRKRLKAT